MNPNLRVPYAYSSRQEKTLDDLRVWLLAHHHPEFVRRLVAWLDSRDGTIGVGGGWRAGGAQPDKPGFAPEGKSFHQDQAFADGFTGAAAVDLVKRTASGNWVAPAWVDVPRQGSAEAARWGVHANVSSESWHMQPIEIDGWQSWWNTGRPAPRAGYPLPTDPPPSPPTPEPPAPAPDPTPAPIGDRLMILLAHESGKDTFWFSADGGATRRPVRSMDHVRSITNAGAVDAVTGQRLTLATWATASVLTPSQLADRLGAAV